MHQTKLVSYCIFTYNQEAYIKEAILGAVNQKYSPLEIVISDDGSTDSTYKIIQEFRENYKGPHQIVINQNEVNLGIGGHFSKVLYELASGDYFIVLGGDDISKEDHVSKAVGYLEQNGEVSMMDFNAEIINERGEVLRDHQALNFQQKKSTLSDYLKLKNISSFAPGRIFKRDILTFFDPISNNCPTEDSVLVLRSLCLGGLVRVNEKLVYYRIHGNNISSNNNLSKLSHLSIISQYTVDVLKLFNDKKKSERETVVLLKRISLEYSLRKLRYVRHINFAHKCIRILYYKSYLALARGKMQFFSRKS